MAQTTNLLLNKHPSGSAQSNNAVINSNWTKLDTSIGNTIGRGNFVSRPNSGQFNGATYWVTDQDGVLCYVWDGTAWETKLGAAGYGLLADRPGSAATGWVYIASDVTDVVLYVWDGAAWLEKSGGSGGGGGTTPVVEDVVAVGSGGAPYGAITKFPGSYPYGNVEDIPAMTLDEAKALLTDYCSQVRFGDITKIDHELFNSNVEYRGENSNAVLSTNGMVYFTNISGYRHDIYKFDYRDKSITKIIDDPWGTSFQADSNLVAAGLAGDGTILFTAADGTNEQGLWIDPSDDSYGTQALTDAHTYGVRVAGLKNGGMLVLYGTYMKTYNSNWSGVSSSISITGGEYASSVCLLPEGKVMIGTRYPVSATNQAFYIYHSDTGTIQTLNNTPTGKFYTNGKLLPNGKVAWISSNHTDPIRLYNPEDDTWSDSNQSTGVIGYTNKNFSYPLLPSGELLIPHIGSTDKLAVYDYRTNDISIYTRMPWTDKEYEKLTWLMLPDGKMFGTASQSDFTYPYLIDFGFKSIGTAMASNPLLLGLV